MSSVWDHLVNLGLAYTALGLRKLLGSADMSAEFGITDPELNPPEGRLELGTLRGFRAWSLEQEDGELTLRAMTYYTEIWREGVNIAVHRNSTTGIGPTSINNNCAIPTMKCSHGFYGYYAVRYWLSSRAIPTAGPTPLNPPFTQLSDLPNDAWPPIASKGSGKALHIHGVIDAFGNVVRGTKGFRAEKAVVMGLALPITLGNHFVSGDLERYILDGLRETYPNIPIYSSPGEMFIDLPLYDKDLDTVRDDEYDG